MRIQLLTFMGCAHAAAARDLLARVLASTDALHVVEEIDTQAAATPERYRRYGSPTILVDGEPIGGGEAPPEGSCCRLYRDEAGRLVGVPTESALRAALERAAQPPRTAQSPRAAAT
jgi:glutaredoxin